MGPGRRRLQLGITYGDTGALGCVLAGALVLGAGLWPNSALATTYGPGGTSCSGTAPGVGPDNINQGQVADPVNGSGTYSNVIGCGADGGNYSSVQVMGPFARATGAGAVTIGYASSAAVRGTALGMQAVASGSGATAIGQWTRALGPGSVAIGGDMSSNDANAGAQAIGGQAIAVGGMSRAMRNGDIAIGAGAMADGQTNDLSALAVGLSARAVGNDAAAFGNNAAANGHFALAVGNFANATGRNAAAVGNSANAAGRWSSAFGNFSSAAGDWSTALGNRASAAGESATALGNSANASGLNSIAIGTAGSGGTFSGAEAQGTGAIAIGGNATAAAVAGAADAIALGGQSSVAAGATSGLAIGRGATVADGATYGIAQGDGAVVHGTDDIAIGRSASTDVNSAGSNVAIGHAVATGAIGQNVAIGSGTTTATASSAAGGAVAIGRDQRALGDGAVALGDPNTANGDGAVALGANNVAAGDSAGNSAANGAVAIGNGNTAVGQGSVALGHGSTAAAAGALAFGDAAQAQAERSVALGSGATAANTGDVALGAASRTAAAVATPSTTIDGRSYSFAGTTPSSTVSVGDAGAERTITNVAAGRISGTSTDAVNGSQLFATNQAIEGVSGRVNTLGSSVATVFGGSTSYDPSTGQVTGGFNFAGNSYTSVQNVFDQINQAVQGGGIRYFHANSTQPDSSATGTDSVAIGPSAVAQNANDFAAGNGATTAGGQPGDVAIGAGSRTAPVVATAGTTIFGTAYQFAGATPASTFSVGDVGAERTITNVAAGRISATSTDAVNGSQLFATNQAIEVVGGRVNTLGDSVAAVFGGNTTYDPATGKVTGGFTFAGNSYSTVQNVFDQLDRAVNGGGGIRYFHANSTLPDSSATGLDSIAIGPAAASSGVNAIAMGNGALASGDGSFASGAGARATAARAMALGDGASASHAGSVALGAGAETQATVATSSTVIDGKEYRFAGTAPVGTVSVGTAGAERTVTNVAAGRISATSTDAINGSQLYATNQAVDNLSGTVSSIGQAVRHAVVYDSNPDGTRQNSISLVGGDPNAPVVIRNVAAGTAPTDAVNVRQLNDGLATTLNQSRAYTDQVAATTLSQANAYTDARFAGLNADIRGVRREARQAAAIGLAASSLRYDDRPGKLSASMGGGVWRGQGAFAIGLGYTSENGLMRGNLSATTTGGEWGVGAGLSITLN
ncbi:YadA-like family protein [Phreatobacter sp. AB_2022a]|uniref:YadA-like family protein n=1 Tax=Phreatobacter sp. AB_2022a TaxID=3003134 RepID=UPI0022873C8D|nr:YadA-like family protein [Phreatobacter sp. AB_2022a]MCZ0735093.1 YadA-like family protein [Phreatobacter sp. AB_2022a]